MRQAVVIVLASALSLAAQPAPPQDAKPSPAEQVRDAAAPKEAEHADADRKRTEAASQPGEAKPFTVQPGTKILLSMINSVSTKHAAEGDRIYLETSFPVLVGGKMVIPPGSYVAGTITESKRPGRVKGRGELYVRFDSLTLPNGVTRDFRSRIGSLDGRASEDLDKSEGKIKSEGDKSGDARTVGETAAAGASVGAIAGSVAGHTGLGAGLGAAAGATAGLVSVLLTRGPDAVLAKGTTLEMVLDRSLSFDESELDFGGQAFRRQSDGSGPLPSKKAQPSAYPGRRWPM